MNAVRKKEKERLEKGEEDKNKQDRSLEKKQENWAGKGAPDKAE